MVLAGRSKPDLEETARRVQAQARRALVAPADVSVFAEVEALMGRAVSDLGRLDIVVNNAGVAKVAPLVEMTDADVRGIVDTNLIGVINGCRAAAPHLIGQGRGKVINVASVLAVVGLPGYSIYSATKGGIIAFTRALGVEWARHGIQVNALAPGWFATDMTDPAFSNPRVNERLTRDIPMRRIGQPHEVGPLAVLLASAGSDFMTGQTIFLDGGHSVA